MTDGVRSLNLRAFLPRSRANGPGLRAVVWFQGCRLHGAGCFNPDTHSIGPRIVVPFERVLARLRDEAPWIEAITVSGGDREHGHRGTGGGEWPCRTRQWP